jgi:hypothetical protein
VQLERCSTWSAMEPDPNRLSRSGRSARSVTMSSAISALRHRTWERRELKLHVLTAAVAECDLWGSAAHARELLVSIVDTWTVVRE